MTTYNFPEVATENPAVFKWIEDGYVVIQGPHKFMAFTDSDVFQLAVNP